MIFKHAYLLAILAVFAGFTESSSAADRKPTEAGSIRVYIGTYTWGGSKGIYLTELELATGRLSPAEVAAETTNPSFLVIHPNRKFAYAIGEIGDFQGRKTGAVSAFSIDATTGKLALLNQQSSGGPGPCHVNVDRTGQCALVANYSGGSIACLPIGADGRLGEATTFIQDKGKGADLGRQEGPHAHSVNVDAANRFVFAADLGLDKVFIYHLDPAAGKLTPNDPTWVAFPPGSGPRHFAFHPNGRLAYVINELKSTITAMHYDAQRGALEPFATVSTLPEGFRGNNTTAEVQVHPSGKFLYGSNRGHDSIAIFAIDEATGVPRYLGVEPTLGKNPRNFAIDPTGHWLLAANQDGNNIVVFRIDSASGTLHPTGNSLKISAPVCVKFMP